MDWDKSFGIVDAGTVYSKLSISNSFAGPMFFIPAPVSAAGKNLIAQINLNKINVLRGNKYVELQI